MVEIRYVINDVKTGKSYQKKVEDNYFQGKKIGESVPGSQLGLIGYELTITGGSNNIGFPMLKNIDGLGKKSVMLKKGIAARKIKRKGMLIRRMVAANTVSTETRQVNLKVIKYGTKPVPELLGIKPKEVEEKEEEKPIEQKKEEKKEEAKPAPEEKAKEVKEEPPKEEKKY